MAQVILFDDLTEPKLLNSNLSYFQDTTSKMKIGQIVVRDFTPITSGFPNFGISNSTFWIKFTVKNTSEDSLFILNLAAPTLDRVSLFIPIDIESNNFSSVLLGEELLFNQRAYLDPNYLFDIVLLKNVPKTIYFKIKSKEAIQLPIYLGTKNTIFNQLKKRDILSGIYFGIMIAMIFYNLFVYFSVRDKSYIYYVVYIILILLTQTSLQGYPFQYLWPSFPEIAQYSLFIFPSLVGIASLLFMNVFLHIKSFNVSLYRYSYVFSTVYIFSIILAFFNQFKLSFLVMEFNAICVSIFMLITSIYIIRRGYYPARYFLAAWSVFLIGVIIYILKDLEILPYNNLTRYTMQIGSGIETVLLSFALAARINIYKKERLEAIAEKERLVREQNIVLEQQVVERTKSLNETLDNLKQTQSQLVEAEKMASLGQLTAGIAHEVNNPINFITSNIYPLREDIKDIKAILNKYAEINTSSNLTEKLEEIEQLKEELQYDYLLNELDGIIHGIEDGAMRTAEIVSGLRNFSRLDESDLKLADINEGINSTLLLLKSKIGDVKLIKKLENLPQIECYPGKINQLVLNIVDNAIFAIKEKGIPLTEGEIEVKTVAKENEVVLTIKDNGVGMNEQTKQKIFDPFFTTKDVGEGTGLGLSIVFGIIKKHNATIEITSELGIGTEFKISLPINNK